MLAPLKDRSILLPAEDDLGQLRQDNVNLKQALRQARRLHKRTATLSARQFVALSNQKLRLEAENQQLVQRLSSLENGLALTSLAQKLMQTRHELEQMRDAARQIWQLERTLDAARSECARLAEERNAALRALFATHPSR